MEQSEFGCLQPRSKLNDIKPTIAADEAVIYYPMSDYKKKIKST